MYCGKAARVAVVLDFVLGSAKIAPVVLVVVMARDGPGPLGRSAGVHTRRSGGHVEVPDP